MSNGRGTGSGRGMTGRRGKGMNRRAGRGRGRGAGKRQGLNSLHGGRPSTHSAAPERDNRKLEALEVNLFNKLRSINIRVPDENAAYAERRGARNGSTAIKPESEIAAPAAKAVVDAEKCIGCGLCVDVCLQEAITLSDVAKINPRKCIACGACAEECPNEAISLS